MATEHENLIGQILDEEDGLLNLHKRHIDAVMELSKKVDSCTKNVGTETAEYSQ